MPDVGIRCQRCGDAMEMKDPAAGQAWPAMQFWICNRCGRHFWTTYTTDPNAPAKQAPPPVTPGATTPAAAPAPTPAAQPPSTS